ncbi:hypothetical protein [Fulvimonas soli]|jgi:hypothetical protein|uniref:DUF3325 family protein n=1 Tax=Fulvimonas soli TaxID=155197 RepID=A0A316HNA4_9GAMM|nr:hypothetical protein [Fulvimonas soli]PWK82729.1 hypothetical protein C7456_11526 [Fulvimonas soli]TNY26107.1 hypothetical protein BV497_10445 [Fulvimonas soli]
MTLLALALCLGGALLFYLASPQQRLRRAALPPRWRLAALLLAAAGALAWCRAAGPGPGLFAALTALMLGWVLLPYLGWWRPAAARP